MTSFDEGALCFDFDDGWLVEKYDDHLAYRRGIEKLKERTRVEINGAEHVVEVGTKAVDFVGVRAHEIHFIEVKDFRGYRIENKRRVHNGDLAIEVAVKVRDTIAGIVGAHRLDGGRGRWRPFVDALAASGRARVCLWLEEDSVAGIRMERGAPGMTLQNDLQQKLSWLGARVLVANRGFSTGLSGIQVGGISDGIVELRARMRRFGQITWGDYESALSRTTGVAGQELKALCERSVLEEMRDQPRVYRAGARWLDWK